VFFLRINVTLSIYFYLDLKYARTLTPKWIVFIFLNLWKLGEGGKMDKVLVMLAAGNAARKVNSIQKNTSFSFSFSKGWLQPSIFSSFYSCFLGGGLSVCKRLSPLLSSSTRQLYPWELDNVGSVRIQVCIDIVRM